MSGVQALRWVLLDADGSPVWLGHSGAVWVASAWEATVHPSRPGEHRWMFYPDAGGAGPGEGTAADLDAAKAAAERAWAAWCERAGLAASAEWERRLAALVRDCQADLARWLRPDSGVSDREALRALLARLDGPQARLALGEAGETGADGTGAVT